MKAEAPPMKEFDRATKGLTRDQAYIRLKNKYAMPHVGTAAYDKIIKQITEYLEL